MTDKREVLQKFQKDYQKYWKVELFDQKGFTRKKCVKCGKFFWTLDPERKVCPEPSCQGYQFIGNPTKKKFDYVETWEAIEKFFVKNNHTSLRRYPVVASWRPDLYFTVASIIDFQRVENGRVVFELPANPLIIPQVCLRFNDLPNVGVTGRHATCFVMIGQHALANEEGYWKDRCIELDFELLRKVFRIPEEEIVFLEEAWIGYGAFGTSLEYFVRGLELGNAVFTQFLGDLNKYEEMENKVIDMGAGLGRFNWLTQGTPTAYDCNFGPVVSKLMKATGVVYEKELMTKYGKLSGGLDFTEVYNLMKAKEEIAKKLKLSLKDLERKLEPIQAIYAIADHVKTLVFAISDGALPSNVAGGYNLRVILRRALSFIDKFKWDLKLMEVANWHIDYLKKMFPELKEHREEIEKILEVEEKRYKKTKLRVSKIVSDLAGRKISEDDLVKLYESEGITPEQLGIEVTPEFYKRITEKHMKAKPVKKEILVDVTGLPETQSLFYRRIYNFKAKVLKISGNYVILDQTAFYPKSGGQDCDLGEIEGFPVVSVNKVGSVIVHEVPGHQLKEGRLVSCRVDKERREILTKHHDAIHIINGAARKILGNHIHQYGSEKTVDKARIDITHYEALSEKEIEAIENLANEIVEKDLPIKKFFMDRSKAEKKYGFGIYQGGYVPSREIRIVEIPGVDVEACGGTHGNSTGEVGFITIVKSKRIADGLVRIEIKAGDVALRYLEEKEKILRKVARKLKVKEEEVPDAIKALFERWKKLRKELRKLKKK